MTTALHIKELLYIGPGMGANGNGSDYTSVDCTVVLTSTEKNYQQRPVYTCTIGETVIGKIESVEHTPYTTVGRFRKDFKPRVEFQIVGGNHRLHQATRKESVLKLIREWLLVHPDQTNIVKSAKCLNS